MIILAFLVGQYTLSPVADPAVLGGSAALWLLPELLKKELVRPSPCPCDPADVNALDRVVTRLRSIPLARASDIMLPTILTVPFGADALDVGLSGVQATEWLKDSVIMLEAVFVASALNQLVKMTFQRPRPFLYNSPSEAELKNPDNMLSFFSGHATASFAIASAYSYTFVQRHPTHLLRFVVPTIAHLFAGTIAAFRVLSGYHFITDVLTGALIGSATGLLVAFAHDQSSPVTTTPMPTPMMLSFGGAY